MGKRGPKPTPTVTLKLRGSTNVVGRRAGEMEPPAGIPEAPDWMTEIEREVWDRKVAELSLTPGLLSVIDGDRLASYCEAWGDFFSARDEIKKYGATCIGDKGNPYQHPAVGRKNNALDRIRKIGDDFGMSPSSRSSIKIAPVQTNAGKKRFFA